MEKVSRTDGILVVVDMQNDFITGVLGGTEARKTVPAVCERIKLAHRRNEPVIYTRDMHFKDYSETLEGKHIPVPHCLFQTWGFELCPEINGVRGKDDIIVDKSAFGTPDLYRNVKKSGVSADTVIELCGVCTDICVIANAVLLRAMLPEIKILVDPNLCAGSTPQKHLAALDVMRSLCIDVI